MCGTNLRFGQVGHESLANVVREAQQEKRKALFTEKLRVEPRRSPALVRPHIVDDDGVERQNAVTPARDVDDGEAAMYALKVERTFGVNATFSGAHRVQSLGIVESR